MVRNKANLIYLHLMIRKHKNIFSILFLIIVIYTFGTLPILALAGGPCNGGVVYVVLGPIILFITLIQLIIFRSSIKLNMQFPIFKKVLAIFCTLFWGFWVSAFFIDDKLGTILYLGPFLILNIGVMILLFSNNVSRDLTKMN